MTPHKPAKLALTGDQPATAFYPLVQYRHTHPNFASNINTVVDMSDTPFIHNRWGYCTPKNNLTFNWRLIKAPMFVIDYVIVHKLTHLLEPNHTSKFWNIIAAQIGQMEKAKGWLREHGGLLEVEV